MNNSYANGGFAPMQQLAGYQPPQGGQMPAYGQPQGPQGPQGVPNPYSPNPAWEAENRRMQQQQMPQGPQGWGAPQGPQGWGMPQAAGGGGKDMQPMGPRPTPQPPMPQAPMMQPPMPPKGGAGYNAQGAGAGMAKRMGGQMKGAISTMGPSRAQIRQQARRY